MGFKMTLFTHSTLSQARAPTPDGVCANSFSSAATVETFSVSNIFSNQFCHPKLLEALITLDEQSGVFLCVVVSFGKVPFASVV